MAYNSSLCQGALEESRHTSQRHPPAAPPLPSVWEVPATQAAERQTLRTAPAHVVPCAEVSAQPLLSREGGQTGCEGLVRSRAAPRGGNCEGRWGWEEALKREED